MPRKSGPPNSDTSRSEGRIAVPERSDTYERILDRAAQLFGREGYAATSVRMIGDAAGVGQSSLYHHAGSKGQILADLHESFVASLLERLWAVEAIDAPATTRIRALISVVIDTVGAHQDRVTVFLREWHAVPDDLHEHIRERRDQVDAVLDRILRKGVLDGELRPDLDTHLVRLGIYGMCNWSYQWFRKGGGHTTEEIADTFASMIVSGIALDAK